MLAALLIVLLMTDTAMSFPEFAQGNSSVLIRSGNVTRSVKGRNVTVACQGEFQNLTSPVWSKDQQPITSDRAVLGLSKKNNYTWILTITDVQLSDAGLYTCSGRTTNASTWLSVDVSPSVVVHVEPPAATMIVNGKNPLLTCEVEGIPRPSSRWRLTTVWGSTTLPSHRQGNTLVVSAKESGTYTCIAYNRAGRILDSIVIRPPEPESTKSSQTSETNQPASTSKGNEEGSGPSIVLILVVIGCLVVLVFLAFMIHTLTRNCSCSIAKSSEDTPCGGGLKFMRGNLRHISNPFSISPRLIRHPEQDSASRVPGSSGPSSARDKDSSFLSVDVAHSKSSEVSRYRECNDEPVNDHHAGRQSHRLTEEARKETEV